MFLERIGVRFKQIYSGLAPDSARIPYLRLLAALNWIGNSPNSHCLNVVSESKTHGRILSANEWEDALYAYRDHTIATSETNVAAHRYIKSLNSMLESLSSGGIVPAISAPLPGLKNVRRRAHHLMSVAEVTVANSGEKESNYIEFARNQLLELRSKTNNQIDSNPSDDFFRSLDSDLKKSKNLPCETSAAIKHVLDFRLDALRKHAIAKVDEAIEYYNAGQKLLLRAQIDGKRFELEYMNTEFGSHKRHELIRKYFPSPNSTLEQVERGIANLLGLIHQQCGGIAPASKDRRYGANSLFYHHRYCKYGGLQSIERMLHPTSDAICAALTLYLIDTGANVCVGRTLDRECLEPSDVDGHRRIIGYKARARGKPIIVDLPESSPSVHAIEWVLSANKPLQAAANESSDKLFLVRSCGSAKLLSMCMYREWFKKFVASIPGLENVSLLPNMLRPSVLLSISLANDGRLAAGMAVGQHGSSVAQGYQQKLPTRYLYDENIKRFQTAFETLVVSNIESAAAKLGVGTQQFKARLGNLRRTGLGTFCSDSRGRQGESNDTCSTLDCWNACPNLLVVAEVESIAALQLWQTSLRSAQSEWERDRPERWEQVWLPWLCLANVVEEKMARAALLKIWNKATRHAEVLAKKTNYVSPKPW